jgi:hydroxypyruvate reductase
MTPESLLRALFDKAVEVADPMRSLAAHLPPKPAGRVVVVGAGKASARMAEAVEAVWGPCEGLVITRYGYGRPCQGIKIVEAAHPVPDAAGAAATAEMLALLGGLGEGDFVLALISGGASALLVAPVEGVSLAEKQAVNAALLACGAPIAQMNTVRKHLSRVKGGQLAAAAYPARVLALMISDVPGDDMAFIGSGPTVGDASTPDQALAILAQWGAKVPAAALDALSRPSGVIPPADPRLSRTTNRIYAAPAQSLAAAQAMAKAQGLRVILLGDALEGEAREVAATLAQTALQARSDAPVLLLSGGELTVTKRGDGIGGPNAEFCLALAIALQGAQGIHAIACDTDGVDGAAEVAGALIGPDTLAKALAAGVDPALALARNDAHSFFAAIGDQVVTGPTLTNVNDFRAILILPQA